MEQPTLPDVLLGIASTNWQLRSSQYGSSITLPVWLMKMFHCRSLCFQRSVTSGLQCGSIAGLSVVKICRDVACQFSVFRFSWHAYTGHCLREIQYFSFSFSAKLTCGLLNCNYIIQRKAETTRMAEVLAVLFTGFSRCDVGQRTSIWVATSLFGDMHTHTHTHTQSVLNCQHQHMHNFNVTG